MHFSVTLFDIVVLLGFIQGIFMAIVLYITPARSKQKSLYSLILLILSLLSFKILLHTLGLWDTFPFRYFPLAIDSTLQPLLFLYIVSLTHKEIKRFYTFLFFAPTIIFTLYALVVYGWALSKHNLLLEDIVANKWYFDGVKHAEDWIAMFSAIAYWIIGYRLILRYRKWIFDTQSDSSLQELNWLKNLVLISGILVIAVSIIVILDNIVYTGRHKFFHLQFFFIYLAVITYYLSFKGYQMYGIPNRVDILFDEKNPNHLSIQSNPNDLGNTKSESKIEFEAIEQLIIHAFENDKLYLNAELSIKEVAQHIQIPVASVSATINYCFQKNFRHLVNEYRVEEVKRRLSNPPSHLSILGIALDCGFNSEASFYRIFRQHTGHSPNSFMRKQLK